MIFTAPIKLLRRCKTYLSGKTNLPNQPAPLSTTITASDRLQQQLHLEKTIFQMNLQEAISLQVIADHLLTGIQALYPGAIGSLLLLTDENKLAHFSAPALPKAYIDAINGVKPGIGVGSCGTAAATGKTVIVKNIATNPLWKDYKGLALSHGLKACWSVPIPHSQKPVLGTFAIYHLSVKAPDAEMLQFIQRWAQIVGVLFEYRDALGQARQLEERYRLSMKATHDMVWDWEIDNDRVVRNDEGMRAIFGFTQDTAHTLDEWLARIHPDDLPVVQLQLQRIKADAQALHFEARYRFFREDGGMMHVLDRGYIQRDHSGEPIRVIGAAQNITKYVEFEEQLKISEEQYRYLFESNPMPMWIFDPETFRFVHVNTTAVQQYGYSEEEFRAMTIFDIRPPEEYSRLQSVLDSEKAERHTYMRGSWKHRKKNGDQIRVEIFSHKIMFNGRVAMLVLANDVTRSVELQEQLDLERNAREQQVMRATVEMQEKARREISHELHDNVNQLLGAAKLYLESGEPGEPLPEEFRQESRTIIQTAIEEIRKLTRSLTPPMLSESGLIGAIEALILGVRKLESFGIHFSHEGVADKNLDAAFQLAAYRIIQEQTNNIIKYAQATDIGVHVAADSRTLYVTISDNGIGFDLSNTKKGVGFININNRATVYRGHVLIETAPGKGCKLQVSLQIP